jgi:hypothetical protein
MLLRTFLTCLALLSSTTAFAQTPKTAPLYEERKIHDPNGIGKFFKGREIAHVMGYQAAGWLERPEREKEENTTYYLKASLTIYSSQTLR